MDSRLTAVGKKLKSYIVDPPLASKKLSNESYDTKQESGKQCVKEDSIEDLQFLARQTNDPTWLSLNDRWKKAPLDLKWLCLCTKDKMWLAYKSLYVQSPLDLRYIGVLTHDPRWLHNCRTWSMTSMEQRLLGIARRDPSVARPNESAIAFDSMIDRLQKKLSEEDFTASPQSQTETFPYDISTAYPPHDQEINTKFKMKINNIINEHPPNQHTVQKNNEEIQTDSPKNDPPKKPAITMLNESLQTTPKKDFLTLKNNKLKEEILKPQPFLAKTDIKYNKVLNERQSSLSLSKHLDSKKKTLFNKEEYKSKRQNNTVTKIEQERKNEQKKTVSKLLSRLNSCQDMNDKHLSNTALSKDIPTAKTLNSLIKKLSRTIGSLSSSNSLTSSSVSSHMPSSQLSLNSKPICSESDSSLVSLTSNFPQRKNKSLLHKTTEIIQSKKSNDSTEESLASDIAPTLKTPEKQLKKVLEVKKQSEASPVTKETLVLSSNSGKPKPPMVSRLETKHITQPKISELPSVEKIKQSKSITLKKVLGEFPLKIVNKKENSLVDSNANGIEMKNVQKSVDFKSVPLPSKTIKAKESILLEKIGDLPKFKAKIIPKSKLPQLSNSLKESSTNDVLEKKNPILNEKKILSPPLLLKKEAPKKIAPKILPSLS